MCISVTQVTILHHESFHIYDVNNCVVKIMGEVKYRKAEHNLINLACYCCVCKCIEYTYSLKFWCTHV